MSSHIQAILLSNEYFTEKTADSWIKRHKYKPIKKVHISPTAYRYRLREPDEKKYEYRTKRIKPYVKFIIGYPIYNFLL